jgi:hypothetical protein
VLKDIWEAGSMSGAEAVAVEGERHLSKSLDSASEERVATLKKSHASTAH